MLEHRGKLPKQMVTFEVATETPVPRDTPVLANGDARVGRITSSVLDPETPGRVPALGYVKRRYIDEGRTLRVGAFDARIVHVVGANAEAPV